MIMSRLGELKTDRGLYKSFQPEVIKVQTSTTKKTDLFRSNVETSSGGLL